MTIDPPELGAAGTAAEAGIVRGAESDGNAGPEPIADPLQAAAEIEREEAERGEVKPLTIVPEPGDVTVPTD
jgi:hypothetical protein